MNHIRMGYGRRLGGDLNELRRHHRIVQSSAHIFIDDLKEAWAFKQEFPQTEIAHRWENLEGDIPAKITPAQWLKNRLADFDALGIPYDQIVLHTSNEPTLTPELIRWHIDYCKLILAMTGPRPRSLLLNFAVGQPEHERIPELRELLAILVAHPELFYLGLHGYAPVVWTAGLNGSAPPGFNARFKPKNPALEYPIDPDEWFTAIFNNACWFMRRWGFWAEYCHREFKKLPNIWKSEYGFDDLADVEWWQQALPRPKDPTSKDHKLKRLGGWKTLQLVWQSFWRQWSHEEALWEQVKASIPVCYEADFVAADGARYPSPVRHVTWFGWSPMKWEDYDLSRAERFKQLYEGHVIALNNLPQKPVGTPTQPPSNSGEEQESTVVVTPPIEEPSPPTPLPQGEGSEETPPVKVDNEVHRRYPAWMEGMNRADRARIALGRLMGEYGDELRPWIVGDDEAYELIGKMAQMLDQLT